MGAWLQLGAAWTANDPSQALLASWALFLLLLAAFWLAQWLATQRLPGRWPTLLIVLGWWVTLFPVWYLRLYLTSSAFWQVGCLTALFHDVQTEGAQMILPISLVFLVALLWWRGAHLGRSQLVIEQISRSFKIGFAALVFALLLIGTAAPNTRDGLSVQLGLALPLFLFLGLAALSLARLAEIRRQRREGTSAHADPTRSWMITLLALSGALVLLTLGIEQIFSFQTWLVLIAFLKPVWDAATTVLGWLALGIAFLFYWTFYLVTEGLHALFGGGQQKSTPPQQPGTHPPLPQSNNTGGIPIEWLIAARWGLIVIGITVALLLLSRAFRTFAAQRREEATDEERESLGTARMMGAQLRALLAALTARFQRASHEASGAGEPAGNSIRLLYRRVLQHAAIRGLRRAPAETPREFAQRLGSALLSQQATQSVSLALADASTSDEQQLLPTTNLDADLEAITIAYEQARYGSSEPSPSEVTILSERTEHLLRRLEQGQAPH